MRGRLAVPAFGHVDVGQLPPAPRGLRLGNGLRNQAGQNGGTEALHAREGFVRAGAAGPFFFERL